MAEEYPSSKVYLTGHSLGGALSVLIAAELYEDFDLGEVYTFGEPRVGNKQMASWLD